LNFHPPTGGCEPDPETSGLLYLAMRGANVTGYSITAKQKLKSHPPNADSFYHALPFMVMTFF